MLRYRVRLNQIFICLFCFPIAELKCLDGLQSACFTLRSRFFPQISSLPVLRPKGAELLHFLLFFLAGRGLGDATLPAPAWFQSKPDVSSLPYLLPQQMDSASRYSLTAAVKVKPKISSYAADSKLSFFLSAAKCKTSHYFQPSFALRVAKRQQKNIFLELMSSYFTGIIRNCSRQCA